MILFEVFSGQTEDHVKPIGHSPVKLSPPTIYAFEELRSQGLKEGFDLTIVSGFRSFESQMRIWNEKIEGKRVVRDRAGVALSPGELSRLSDKEKIFLLLRWSALPGASRHHWGTDFDVIDRNSVPEGYKVSLTPQEVEEGGVFLKFHQWLFEALPKSPFFRPYENDLGGVSPEWWHLSHKEGAAEFESFDYFSDLSKLLRQSSVLLKEEIITNLSILDSQFIRNISHPLPSTL